MSADERIAPAEHVEEYLKLRKRLKEEIRNKNKNCRGGSASVSWITDERKRKLPYEYGSFFGPSETVISRRVIEESKSIFAPTPRENRSKVQTLKKNRDYSLLFSDDATKLPEPSEAAPQTAADGSRPVNGRKDSNSTSSVDSLRPPNNGGSNGGRSKKVPASSVTRNSVRRLKLPPEDDELPEPSKVAPQIAADGSMAVNGEKNSNSTSSVDLRPPPDNGGSNGTERSNKVSSSSSVTRNPVSKVQRPLTSKPRPSKPQSKPQGAAKKKRHRQDSEDEAAILMIRKMFGYDPSKYADRDYDVSNMEASFQDIIREEKRSAKIARREDEQQLRLINQEEKKKKI